MTQKKMPQSNQQAVRKLGRQRRRDLAPLARLHAQQTINHRLLQLDIIRRAQRIAVYMAMGSEVDISDFMSGAWQQGKQLFVPCVHSSRLRFTPLTEDSPLRRGRLGIAEPLSATVQKPQFLDVVVTPLVAFDHDANRIGQGGGYYDRRFAWLKHRHYWRKPALIGVAFDCQCVAQITPNPWDISLQTIITEQALYPCSTG